MRRNTGRLRRFASAATAVAAAAVVATLVACTPLTPVERVSKLRAEYSATLNSFSVTETPMADAMGEPGEGMQGEGMMGEGTEGEAMGGEAMGGEGMGEGMDAMPMDVPTRKDVLLDIVLRKEGGTDTLPGITVDIYQVAADETEKATYRVYVDTSRLNPGSRKAVSHVLKDVEYAEGDGFAVEIRQPVAPELYPEYQEYSEAEEGGAE